MADQTKYTNKLQGSRILVLGGSSGIGFAAAECLLEQGAIIILSSSTPDKVANKVAQLQQSYPSKKTQVSGHACNLADQAALEANLKSLLDASTDNGANKLDHIIHTAGDPLKILPLHDVELPGLIQAGMVRFFSAILLCKLAPAYMSAGPAASVTITTGGASQRPNKGWAAVVGYLTGLHGVARSMALELAPIRVNCISPGAVDSELWDSMLSADDKAQMLHTVGSTMPTGRVGSASDVAECYAFCVKDHNLTGSVVSSNGGVLLVGPHGM